MKMSAHGQMVYMARASITTTLPQARKREFITKEEKKKS
jgi:hypothetical protein